LPRNHFGSALGTQPAALLGRISPEKAVDRAIWIAKRCGIPLKIAAKVDAVDRDYFESEIRKLLAAPDIEYVGEKRHTVARAEIENIIR
jgi:hypothetical protein